MNPVRDFEREPDKIPSGALPEYLAGPPSCVNMSCPMGRTSRTVRRRRSNSARKYRSTCNTLFTFRTGNCVIISGYDEAETTLTSWRLRRIGEMSSLRPHDRNWWSCNFRGRAHGAGEMRTLPDGVFHRQRRAARQSAIRTGLAGNPPDHLSPACFARFIPFSGFPATYPVSLPHQMQFNSP